MTANRNILAAGDLFLVKLASERKNDRNSFVFILDQISNVFFSSLFSLRPIGTEIDGGVPPFQVGT